MLHRYADGATLNGAEGTTTIDAAPGQARPAARRQHRQRAGPAVGDRRARTGCWPSTARDVNEPGEITGEKYGVPAGGRVDLGFVVPEGGVRVDFGGTTAIVLGDGPHRR